MYSISSSKTFYYQQRVGNFKFELDRSATETSSPIDHTSYDTDPGPVVDYLQIPSLMYRCAIEYCHSYCQAIARCVTLGVKRAAWEENRSRLRKTSTRNFLLENISWGLTHIRIAPVKLHTF